MRNEDFRRKASLIICWGAWAGAFVLTTSIVFGVTSRQYGTLVVLLIGIGVTSSLIRSRYRLADTIAQVFETGIRLGEEQERELQARARHPEHH